MTWEVDYTQHISGILFVSGTVASTPEAAAEWARERLKSIDCVLENGVNENVEIDNVRTLINGKFD